MIYWSLQTKTGYLNCRGFKSMPGKHIFVLLWVLKRSVSLRRVILAHKNFLKLMGKKQNTIVR